MEITCQEDKDDVDERARGGIQSSMELLKKEIINSQLSFLLTKMLVLTISCTFFEDNLNINAKRAT
jgi:hypothetical protein